MTRQKQISFALLGALIGFAYAYATRPVIPFFGVQIPMEVLSSTAPLDEALKKMLIEHLAMITGIGFVVGGVAADLFGRFSGRSAKV